MCELIIKNFEDPDWVKEERDEDEGPTLEVARARNPKDCNGNTPLHFAVENGHDDIFDLIVGSVGNGAMEINPPNNFGTTPIHLAAKIGNFHVCEHYLDIDGSARFPSDNFVAPADSNNDTPLHFAARFGHFEICKRILEHVYFFSTGTDDIEFDKVPANNNGDTPLFLAVENGHSDVIKLIIEHQRQTRLNFEIKTFKALADPCEYSGRLPDNCQMTTCQVPNYIGMPIEAIFDKYHNFGFIRQNDGPPNKRAKLNNGDLGGSMGGSKHLNQLSLNHDGPGSSASGSKHISGGSLGGFNQVTPDTAKHKCKNFLAELHKLANEEPSVVAKNVHTLIQSLIDSEVDPETFATKLQFELNSSPQPCLVPLLKQGLPFLQNSLLNGQLSIDGVRPPRMTPNTAKHQSRNILATLSRQAKEESPAAAENIQNLIQDLIDGLVDPETFATRLRPELSSLLPPNLASILKRGLPFLQNSLLSGELSIDGIVPGIWINHEIQGCLE